MTVVRKLIYKSALLIGCVLGLARAASADTVSISTGVADWTIDSFSGLSNGPATAYGPLPLGHPDFGSTAPIITPNGAWTAGLPGQTVQDHDPNAKWIGPTADANAKGSYGEYTYKLELTHPALTINTTYELNGWFSSDNLVESFTMNGVAATITAPSNVTDPVYGFTGSFKVGPNAGKSPITLLVTVYNESTAGPAVGKPYGPTDPFSDANPTGLIVAGTVTAVPLPAAAWGGIALLGLLAVPKLRRLRSIHDAAI